MASQNQDSGKKYYRSNIIGLSVVVGKPLEGQPAPQTVRFQPYIYITDMGEELRFGYLETDNKRAIEILARDSNVVEIDQDNFDKYTDVENEKVRKAAL